MPYTRTTWADYPATTTPITATALNNLELGVVNATAVTDAITSGAWTTYTPTIGNLTQGNGTLVAKYARVGRIVSFYVSFTLGSTSSVAAAAVSVTLPVTASAAGAGSLWGQMIDTGTQNYPMFPLWQTTTAITLAAMNAAGTYATAAGLATSVPFTWGSTDVFVVGGTYEAAS